jgi:hypothetical protein
MEEYRSHQLCHRNQVRQSNIKSTVPKLEYQKRLPENQPLAALRRT